MPVGTVEVSVDGESSFAQTLRHLVHATDMWLGRAILETDQPFHPLGLVDTGEGDGGLDMSVFTTVTPSYDDVLEARASRVAMVCDFIATVTPDECPVPPQTVVCVSTCLTLGRRIGTSWVTDLVTGQTPYEYQTPAFSVVPTQRATSVGSHSFIGGSTRETREPSQRATIALLASP